MLCDNFSADGFNVYEIIKKLELLRPVGAGERWRHALGNSSIFDNIFLTQFLRLSYIALSGSEASDFFDVWVLVWEYLARSKICSLLSHFGLPTISHCDISSASCSRTSI